MPLEAPLVLIVDDDEHIRDLLRTRLELDGLNTISANDGVEALATLTNHRPAAMLLDVSMPRMDGFELLEALRRTRRTPPPTLMLTARNAAEDVQRAIAMGAKDYLAKPFNDQMLLRRVRRLLRAPVQPTKPPADSSGQELFL
ncbi:MAG: response regulator [Caulobacter sp.]|jgi:two-component system OmpR family response regulator|nr:response regulator [Caulobacter sp.]